MPEFDKYPKIVILSTLVQPRSLAEISAIWFNNKGRLYQPTILPNIQKTVKEDWINQQGKNYQANFNKLINYLLEEIIMGEDNKISKQYREWIKYFYTSLGGYTRKTYLNFEVIKSLTKLDQNKVEQLDIRLLVQLPFILRYIEKQNKTLLNIVVQVLNLEEYVKIIEKQEIQNYEILKEKKQVYDWIESFEKITSLLNKLEKKELNILEKNVQAIKTLGGTQ